MLFYKPVNELSGDAQFPRHLGQGIGFEPARFVDLFSINENFSGLYSAVNPIIKLSGKGHGWLPK